MTGNITTFGEIMLRLSPQGSYRFIQADLLEATFGGGEANVAVSLSNFGLKSKYITKLPKHEIGQAAVNSLRKFGVDTTEIVRGGERVGIYFMERGASQRASNVIYDRSNSAIACASPSDFDWNKIFEGTEWFHFTGISPALSESAAKICRDACIAAKEMGITVSCDLNYRKKLWTKDRASEVMGGLMQYVDVCIANEEDASSVFGIEPKTSDIEDGRIVAEEYFDVAKELHNRFGFSKVAITLSQSMMCGSENKC